MKAQERNLIHFRLKNRVITNRYWWTIHLTQPLRKIFVGIDDVIALVGENVTIFFLQKYRGCLRAFKVTKIKENCFA